MQGIVNVYKVNATDTLLLSCSCCKTNPSECYIRNASSMFELARTPPLLQAIYRVSLQVNLISCQKSISLIKKIYLPSGGGGGCKTGLVSANRG